jgi:hypothetical protein
MVLIFVKQYARTASTGKGGRIVVSYQHLHFMKNSWPMVSIQISSPQRRPKTDFLHKYMSNMMYTILKTRNRNVPTAQRK